MLSAAVLLVLSAGARAAWPVFEGIGGPFSAFTVEGRWCQRIVTLRNPAQTPMRVKVSYVAAGADGSQRIFSRLLDLPGGSVRRATLAARPERLTARSGQIRGFPAFDETYTLSDASSGRVFVASTDHKTAGIPDGLTTLVVVRGGFQEDTDAYLGNLDESIMGRIARLSSFRADLPDRWYGYDIARVVALSAMREQDLRPSQWQALLDWTGRGGLLVVAGGQCLPELLRGRLGGVAGVAAAGAHEISSLRLDGDSRQPVELDGQQYMSELLPDGAAVLCRAEGLPLLTDRPFGQGRVLVLAVPLGAIKDSRLHGKVLSLVGRAMDTGPVVDADSFSSSSGGSPVQPAREALNAVAGRHGAPPAAPVVILIGLAGATILAGALLRPARRGEMLWAVLAPLSVLVALGMYAYGALRTDEQRLSYVGLVVAAGDGQARAQQAFAYYSGPAEQTASFTADNPRAGLWPLQQASGPEQAIETFVGGTMFLADQTVRRNSTAAMLVDAMVPAVALTGKLSFNESGLAGSLVTRFGADIEDAVIWAGGETFRLGRLGAGIPTAVAVGQNDRLGEGEFTSAAFRSPLDNIRNRLMRQLTHSAQAGQGAAVGQARSPLGGGRLRRVDGRAVLIGYSHLAPLDCLAGRRVPGQGWSVIVWPLEFAAPAPGSKVSIPNGFLLKTFEPNPAVLDAGTHRFHGQEVDFGTELIVRIRLPEALGTLDGAAARLAVNMQARGFQLTVCGLTESSDGRRQRTVIGTIDQPSGQVPAVTVERSERFLSPRDGCYVFSLNIHKPHAENRATPAIISQRVDQPQAGPKWRLSRVDVTMEGVSR